MSPPIIDYYCLAPEIVASAFGILLMLVEPFVPTHRKGILARVALLGAGAALASILVAAQYSTRLAFYELIRLDDFSLFLHAIIFGITLLAVLASYDYLEREGLPHGEFYALLLFAATGMGIMAGANELVTAFVGLEISSIASYVMAGWRRDVLKSNESAMKYFLLGSFATAFFLYGVAMVYGSMGTTFLDKLRVAIGAANGGGTLLTLGMGMMFVGLGFKIATVPFQVWTPDVYEGAPAPVTAFFASAPKAAALAMMLRIFYTAFADAGDTWFWAVWISAVLSMFVGNIAALVQTNVKRMLAYSSIAHAGYLMVAFATRTEIGVAAILFYLVAYALMKLGAFVTVAHLSGGGERRLDVDDYAGLATKRPLTAACLALYLLSLLGLPPTAGFLGKLYVFNAALNSKLVWLAVLLAVNSVIAAYYYLSVIMAMYFRESKDDWAPEPMPRAVAVVLLITAAGTLYFGLFPGAVMNFAVQGALSLR
jgi:NADH-quinone oxidoreductase subunit N